MIQQKPMIPQQAIRQLPPSKIPPRGYRKPRQPKDIPPIQVSDDFNFPTLNEMMAFDTRPVASEIQKMHHVHNLEVTSKANHKKASEDFFQGTTRPTNDLPMPDLPSIQESTVFILHYDQRSYIEGLYFSVQPVQQNQPQVGLSILG